MRRKLLAITAIVGGSAAVAVTGWAFFSATGSAHGGAAVGTVTPPTAVAATVPNPAVRTVHVAWTPPTTPDGSALAGYTVDRSDGSTTSAACGTGSAPLAGTATSCDDTNVPAGVYTYTVTSQWNSWTSTSTPSAPVTVLANILDHFTVVPSTPTPTAGTQLTVTVSAIDQYGALLTSYTGSQCVTFSGPSTSPSPASSAPSYPSGGTGCTGANSLVTFSSGVGTPGVTLFDAQTATLTVTDVASSKSGSTSLTVSAAGIDHFLVSPSTATPTAGTSFTATLTAHDLYDNTATSYTGAQTVAWSGLATSPAPANHAPSYPATSVTFVSGSSTTTLTATAYASGSNTLSATASGHTGSTSLTVSPAAASQFLVPTPTTRTAGASFTLTATAADAYANVAAYSGNKTLSWSGPANAPSGTPPSYPANPVSFTAGAATVSITLYKAESPAITVGDGTITGATGSFTVSPAAASKVGFTTQPTSATSTTAISPSPAVAVRDAYSNVVTTNTSSVTVAIGTNPSSGTLSGTTTVAASAGVATFSGLSIDKAGTAYTLVASDGSLTSATSSTFNINVGSATKLAFTTQPSGATSASGVFPIQPAVTAQDAGGNTVTTYSTGVTLAIGANPGGATLSGCAANPLTPTSGVATFSGCHLNKTSNGYTFVATSGTLTSATSSSFNVTGAASKLVFTTQPGGGTAGSAWAQQPVVSVQDNGNNVVTADSGNVALALTAGTGGTGAVLSCNATTMAASYGVATFSGCSIQKTATTNTLTASRTGMTVASNAFTISAGPATQMAFWQQPASGTLAGSAFATQPLVLIEDTYGNLVTTYVTPVTMAITAGTGTPGAALTCATNPVTPIAGNGYAAFAGCSINTWGNAYTLTATTGSLTITSTVFDVWLTTPAFALNNKATGTLGLPEAGDTIVITYPDPIAPSTFCGGWSGTTTLTNVTVSFTNSGGDAITGITDTADCTGTSGFRAAAGLGTVAMGVTNKYFTAAGSFTGGTATWNSSTATLTITLGTMTSGTVGTGTNTTATYTPNASLSVPSGATFATANGKQF